MAVEYVSKQKLKELVIHAQTTGVVGEELGRTFHQIASGSAKRYCPGHDDDDIQGAVMACLRAISKIKPDQNVFSYFTTVSLNYIRQEWRNKQVRKENECQISAIQWEQY